MPLDQTTTREASDKEILCDAQESNDFNKYTWDVSSIYPTYTLWEQAKRQYMEEISNKLEALKLLESTIATNEEDLLSLMDTSNNLPRELHKLCLYAQMRFHTNMNDPQLQKDMDELSNMSAMLNKELAWIDPAITVLEESYLLQCIANPIFINHKRNMGRLLKMKPHIPSSEISKVIQMFSPVLSGYYNAYRMRLDVETKYPDIYDSHGESHPLTKTSYFTYLQHPDRTLRKHAVETRGAVVGESKHTYTELLKHHGKGLSVLRQLTNHESSLEASLMESEMNANVYHRVIKAAHRAVSIMHRYLRLKKKMLGLDQLEYCDVFVPFIIPKKGSAYESNAAESIINKKVSYQEAVDLVLDSLFPLGDEYIQKSKSGLLEERWVDVFPSSNKQSGAYSSGCYDTKPFILLNYDGTYQSVSTLAHELGHSMHSYLSNTHQPISNAGYTIAVAEVASTVNEKLLLHSLEKSADKELAIYSISMQIEDFMGTFIRQSFLAEFELKIMQSIDQNVPFSTESIAKEFHDLERKYYGETVKNSEHSQYSWMNVPHFYYNFYVYQYATGLISSNMIKEKLMSEADYHEKYLQFLKNGNSVPPLQNLANIGVDLETDAPYDTAITTFHNLVASLEKLMNEE